MKAVGVTYAAEINKATDRWGVDQALMQSIIDMSTDELNPAGIPEDAKTFARNYASNRGFADVLNDGGAQHPESNIMAAAWWLVRMQQIYNDQWSAVKAYFEMSPVGEGKMRHIFYVLYPKWEKEWRHLA